MKKSRPTRAWGRITRASPCLCCKSLGGGSDIGRGVLDEPDGGRIRGDHPQLARTFLVAHEHMLQSESAPRLLGADFVRAYTSVKGLEYDSYLREVSAWERRFLVPQA